MKKLLLTASLAILSSVAVDAQIIFSEDFDGIGGPTAGGAGTYAFPAGWFLRNVDNGTPAGAVSYVNEAWERREDFSFNVTDSCAFSTSWNTPVVTANDWMWTPLIGPLPAGTTINWNAVTYDASYPDGYEIRVMTAAAGPPTGGTGVIGNQITGSTSVFSIAAENTTWTNRSVSLAAYAGQSIYIAFRNNSTDEFLLLIDDILVSAPVVNDARLSVLDTVCPYTIVPLAQTQALNFSGDLMNNGSNTLNNVYVSVEVFNSASTVVYTANSTTIPTLAAAGSASWTIAGYDPTVADFYDARFIVHHSLTDPNTTNDSLFWNGYLVDDSTYARDDGTVTGGLGIGAGNGGYLGQDFEVVNADLLTQVMVYVTAGYTGEPMAAVIWNMSGGVPTTIAFSTDTILYPDDSASVYWLPIHNGPVMVSPGEYAVTFVEFDSTMQLGNTMSIFTAGHMWVNWPTIPGGTWENIEAFGAGFARAQVIRPIFGDVCLNNTATASSTAATCISCADGSAMVTTSGTDGVLTYSWSPSGGNAASATGLLQGVYVVTVTDGFGCVTMDTVTVGYDVCGLFSSSIVPSSSSCQVCADGSAQVIISGNNGPLTYQWSNGGTSDTIQNVLTGTYTVVVVDSLGCSDTLSVLIGYGICGSFTSSTSSANATCGSCADGSAWVVPVGNNGPMTYLWSNGGTSDSIQNVLPGTYYVTITDSAGCTAIDSVVVQFGTSVAVIENSAIAAVYPNPCNGVFQIDLSFAKATDVTITVVNMLGEVVATQKVSGATTTRVDMKINTAPGVYSVRVSSKDDEIILPLSIVK